MSRNQIKMSKTLSEYILETILNVDGNKSEFLNDDKINVLKEV